MKTKVLIIVRGGIVQAIHSNNPDVKYLVVDYDEQSPDSVVLGAPSPPEQVKPNMWEIFDNPKTEDDKWTMQSLKDQNF